MHIGTAEYRPLELWLGNERFGADLDMWSLGCVAAELFLRRALFSPSGSLPLQHAFLARHLSFLGVPSEEALGFLNSLPCKPSDFGLVFQGRPILQRAQKAGKVARRSWQFSRTNI